MNSPWISPATSLVLAAVGVAAFHVAYEFEAAAPAIVVYLACLFRLAWVRSPRWAFYLGLAIGTALATGQLWFFHEVFGWAAAGLWAILGLWIGFFLLLSRIVVARWPRYGALWLPVIWLALEYTRGELYPLRFAWLTPGFALSHPAMVPLASAGMYGFSFFVLSTLALAHTAVKRRATIAVAALIPSLLLVPGGAAPELGPLVVGIQLEGPREDEVLAALDRALADEPGLDLVVLGEYCFDGAVPQSTRDWCARHEKHLIAGGKEFLAGSDQFYDMAFVISPTGEIVFSQAKAVPIQFFNDGLPAQEQRVWKSPWGNIGIAICYDLGYARVIDRLVEQGAQALIIPTMDAEDWGEHEHRLHARVAPVRAREYGIPIFRLASSGISQFVDRDGRVIAAAPFPGQGERLIGSLAFSGPGKLPIDRYVALPAVVVVAMLIGYLALFRLRAFAGTRFGAKPSPGTNFATNA
ncbi:MAG: nitrilase-related carbon-nitrogen hydrolase [Deltaproteobacteria bacterium]